MERQQVPFHPDRCPGVPASWTHPGVPLSRLFDDAVTDFPGRVAVEWPDGTAVTYAELAGVVAGLAAGLAAGDVRQVVIAEARPAATVVVALAAWRLGLPVVLCPVATMGGADAIPRRLARAPWWDPDRDLCIASPRSAAKLGLPAGSTASDDFVHLGARDGVVGGVLTAARRLVAGRGRSAAHGLSDMATGKPPATPPRVDPDSLALVHVDADGRRRTWLHRHLVAATFQSRLWIPDMAAGSERVAAAMPLDSAPALVVGPLLAVLTGAALQVADDLAEAVRGATVAFASPATWRRVTTPTRTWPRLLRRAGRAPASLRIGGVVVQRPDHTLSAADVRRVVAHTEGARLRHFWTSPTAAGPVSAQPVYGRIRGWPGALPVTDTQVVEVAGRLLARGPQFGQSMGAAAGPDATTAARSWHHVDDHVPAPLVPVRIDVPGDDAVAGTRPPPDRLSTAERPAS